MSDPSPNGDTQPVDLMAALRESVDRARADRKAPVPSSDTPSDERDEVCGSIGPRIGDEPERPRCAQPLDHDGQHRGFPGSGFESVQWGGPIMRDGDFARTYRPDPPPTPVDGDSGRASEQFIEALTEAMQNAWNDFVGDTGCYPDDFEIHGNELHAQFGRSNFVRFVAGWLPTAPPVGEERRPSEAEAVAALAARNEPPR